jgi:hypothetical protein
MPDSPAPVIDAKAADGKAQPTGFARVLGFFDSATKTIVTITGLIVAVGGAWVAIHHFGADDSAGPGLGASVQVQACERAHGLTQQHQRVQIGVGDANAFASCNWPAPRYADTDGYSQISYATTPVDLPESSAADAVDRFSGPCKVFLLRYDFKSQGDDQHPIPASVPAGTITQMDQADRPYAEGNGFDSGPDGDQVDFVRNDKVGVTDATCGS